MSVSTDGLAKPMRGHSVVRRYDGFALVTPRVLTRSRAMASRLRSQRLQLRAAQERSCLANHAM